MTDEQWQQAWNLYNRIVNLTGEERQSVLSAYTADSEVLQEVILMLEDEPSASDDVPHQAASRCGSSFGRYHVGELLGRGGMGEVYAAEDPELGRKVAIKFLAPSMAADTRAVERLIREAKAASGLNHPHIITVYEVVRANSDVAIAMELVEGRALREFCGHAVKIARVIQWGRQIAQALAGAHQRNIIHRDIKPENLMVRDDGIIKVLDFGIAGNTERQQQILSENASGLGGTLSYMSPEQLRGGPATGVSDVFALGVVLYELATGQHPFRSDSLVDTAHAITHVDPSMPSSLIRRIPASFRTLLLRMLNKDPEKRPSALAVDQQLTELEKPGRHSATVTWIAAAIAVVTVLGGFAFLRHDLLIPKKEPQFVPLTHQVNENRVASAALSADGKTLLYVTFTGLAYRRRMSDGLTEPLDSLKELRVDRLVWFSDGSKVLVNGSLAGARDRYEPGIWIMPAGQGPLVKVVAEASNGIPSPDGSRIAFTSSDGSLLSIFDLATGKCRPVRHGGHTMSFTSLFWSPDGKRICFQRTEYGRRSKADSDPTFFLTVRNYQYNYEAVDVISGRAAVAVKDFEMESACSLKDGRVLFLRRAAGGTSPYHLWTLRTDPASGRFLEQPRQLTSENYDLTEISTSANGRDMVVVRAVNNRPNVYVADLAPAPTYPRFARIRRLTFTDADEYPHSWTPDGKSVIFESNRNGTFDLFRQDIDQREAQPLVVSANDKVLAHLSPDAKWILYNQLQKKQRWGLIRVPLRGGTPEVVLPDVGVQGEFTCSSRPAGRCVLRTVLNDQFLFWDLDPLHGKGQQLTKTDWSPAIVGDWDISPDGSEVAIPNHDPRDAKIRLVPLDSRKREPVKTVTIETLKNLSGVVWAADGRGWFVSVRGTNRGLLFYVDLEGRVLANLLESMAPTYAVASPDGLHVAFADWTVSANVWRLQGR